MIRTGSAELVKDLNVGVILDALKRSQPISRVKLAKLTGLSFPTVSRIVNGLRKNGLLVEDSAGESTGGRRPILLRFDPEASYVVGVYVDAPETQLALLNLDGETKAFLRTPTRPERGPSLFVDRLVEQIDTLSRDGGIPTSKITGIGIAATGNVSPHDGVLVYSMNLNWRNVPLARNVRDRTGIVTTIEGDCGAMAMGEHLFGVARHVRHLAWVNVSSGVGVGLIENGELYRGKHGYAGELGHITVLRDGPPCPCGKRGCLEALVGYKPVLDRLVKMIARGSSSLISDMVKGSFEDLRIEHLFRAAEANDTLARAIVDEMSHYLGLGISIIANLLDPELIVVGGQVVDGGGDAFLEMVTQSAKEAIIPERTDRLDVRRSALGQRAGVIGGGGLIYREGLKARLMVG